MIKESAKLISSKKWSKVSTKTLTISSISKYSECKVYLKSPYSNQKPDVREFNRKAAKVFLLKFLQEFTKKQHLLSQLSKHHALVKHAAYSLKRHMLVKKKETSKLLEEWDKEVKKIKSWTKDIAEAYKKYSLGTYIKEFWRFPQLLTP